MLMCLLQLCIYNSSTMQYSVHLASKLVWSGWKYCANESNTLFISSSCIQVINIASTCILENEWKPTSDKY